MLLELEAALIELDENLDRAKKIIRTMEPAGLAYQPGVECNSISVLAMHMAGSLKWWIGEIIGGRDAHRDREAEFHAHGVSADVLVHELASARELVDEVFETISPAMLIETRQARTRVVTVRQSVLHVIAHTAEHVGHIEMTAQLWKKKEMKT